VIVRARGRGEPAGSLHLITQPDHAALARRIMERSEPLLERPRCASILLAIGEHDNGWTEIDAAPLVDPASGEILDFIRAPLEVRQGVWPRAVARLAQAPHGDPWAATLVAQHALVAYDRLRVDSDWHGFFATLESLRDEMEARAGGTREELLADYAFVRLGDLVSLAFCTATEGNLSFGPWTAHLAGSTVVVDPDPFGGATVPIEIHAREIQGDRFRDEAHLRDALGRAPWVTLSGLASGTPKR
jgi:hypothetical protein